jgi:hypothetical protein
MSGCANKVRAFIGKIDTARAARLNQGVPNRDGMRLIPSRTPQNDANSEFRIDRAHVYDAEGKVYDLVLQANRDAKSQSIKDFIKNNTSDAKLASITMDTTECDINAEDLKAKLRRFREARRG